VIFGSIASGESRVENPLLSDDVRSAIGCIRSLGVIIEEIDEGTLLIRGNGLRGLSEPSKVLDAGNSGTCMRILSGILASQNFYSVISGDDSLRSRPMSRIVIPLRGMGAEIWGHQGGKYPPLSFRGSTIGPINYELPIASAQVKSCIMAAALYADGKTVITEPVKSRDHSEKMLKSMGAEIRVRDNKVILQGGREINSLKIFVPGDISSAAYLIAAGVVVADSSIRIRNVGLNPTRTGFLNILKRMGATIKTENLWKNSCDELIGDLHIKSSELSGIVISGDEVPGMIDELPLVAVLGTAARGRTVISGAAELRVKESDRIAVVVKNLKKMGIDIMEKQDGFEVAGKQRLSGAAIDTAGDHRIAMTFAVAALIADSPTEIENPEIVSVSYPGFWNVWPFSR